MQIALFYTYTPPLPKHYPINWKSFPPEEKDPPPWQVCIKCIRYKKIWIYLQTQGLKYIEFIFLNTLVGQAHIYTEGVYQRRLKSQNCKIIKQLGVRTEQCPMAREKNNASFFTTHWWKRRSQNRILTYCFRICYICFWIIYWTVTDLQNSEELVL